VSRSLGRRPGAAAAGIKSVGKVLDILEYLAAARRPAGVSEIARAVGFHVSTAHRLVQTLVARGYVDQDADREYVLGTRLLAIGHAVHAGDGLLGVAQPELERLRDSLGETIHLGVYRDGQVFEIAAAIGRQPVSVASGSGVLSPAHCTALGKVLLAALDDDSLQAFFARGPLKRLTPGTIVRRNDLLKVLEGVRLRGYGTDDEELAADLCCVAVPVRSLSGRTVAAVAVAMPKSRFRASRLPEWTHALAASAARIGARIRDPDA
jgi:DNA-binding IclR family transcriptional regulator